MEMNTISPPSDNPLVSIIVITYNSAKYILETLESVKAQTYKNIELIVSDDCSTDNTVEICRKWQVENNERFVRSNLITIQTNTGIPSNCNRGLFAAQGEWIKYIAGDDILIDTCINDFVKYLNYSEENILVLCGAVISFNTLFSINNFEGVNWDYQFYNRSLTAYDQHKLLLTKDRIMAPGVIINKKLLIDTNGFNEKYKYFEDYPLWIKLTGKGIRIYGFPKPVAYYRLHSESSDNSTLINNPDSIVNDNYWNLRQFSKDIIYPKLNFIGKIAMEQTYFRNVLIMKCGNNKNNILCRVLVLIFKLINITKLINLISNLFKRY